MPQAVWNGVRAGKALEEPGPRRIVQDSFQFRATARTKVTPAPGSLKGEGRPINALSDRMEVLSAFEMVDGVTSFEQDTPQEIIERHPRRPGQGRGLARQDRGRTRMSRAPRRRGAPRAAAGGPFHFGHPREGAWRPLTAT